MQTYEAKIVIDEHIPNVVLFKLGKLPFARIIFDEGRYHPYRAKLGFSTVLDGRVNPDWRFKTKQLAINHVLKYAGVEL